MSLRLTILALALITFLSASTGGYFYHSSLKKTAAIQAEKRAYTQLRSSQKTLNTYLSENKKPSRTLAGMPEIKRALDTRKSTDIQSANRILDHFNTTLEAEACYIMDTNGVTIASSNRNSAESFVGKNFSFRPYYKRAMRGALTTYLALGTTSKRRGVYWSYPVFKPSSIEIIGITVIKASIEPVEKELLLSEDEHVVLTDPNGLIFISTNPQWLFTLLQPVPQDTIQSFNSTLQFGSGPWPISSLQKNSRQQFIDEDGNDLFTRFAELDHFPGWKLIYLGETDKLGQLFSHGVLKITGPLIFIFCLSIGTAVFLLYLKASSEILKRKSTQAALLSSERRYRNLYENTPAMLHSIDVDGKLLSVSNLWLTSLGYTRDEVIGKYITSFFTRSSRIHAQDVVIPSFFKIGYCNDIPYQFIKKDGSNIDILLSAIAERDEEGNILRSLAVSEDVTERNKAQNALEKAKEELSLYSRQLEKEVSERTLEINSILTNTPDVIYITDLTGQFKLVNKRFKEVFRVTDDVVANKFSIFDVIEESFATPIHANNCRVIENKSSIQIDELFPQVNGNHTFLSVKFPIFDDENVLSAVCSISTDVTELYKAQSQLRRLSASIMESQEKERSAIARELHDELGQVLTALRMEAMSLQDRLCEDDIQGSKRAKKMCEMIDNTIDEVRGMATRLRPGVLDDLGLIDALEWYTTDFEKRTGITCFFEHPHEEISLPDTLTTAAYRITQEALTNAARYSNTHKIDVKFVIDDDITISIQDHGSGFNISNLDTIEGLGIAGMRERALLAGGTLLVDSTIENGTTITFRVTRV